MQTSRYLGVIIMFSTKPCSGDEENKNEAAQGDGVLFEIKNRRSPKRFPTFFVENLQASQSR